MELTTTIVVPMYEHIFANARLNGLSLDGKKRMLKFIVHLKRVSEQFRAYQKEAVGKLKKENHDEMMALLNNPDAEEEKKSSATQYLQELEKELGEVTSEELSKTTDFDDLQLDEEDAELFVANNIDLITPSEGPQIFRAADMIDFLVGGKD